MATWQFDVELVFEHQQAAPDDLGTAFARILPPTKSWHPELSVFGTDDGDRLDLWMPDDAAETHALARIDVRNGWSQFCENLLALAQESNCKLLLRDTSELIEPDQGLLRDALRQSDAARFVSDPKAFLAGLER